MRLVPGEAAPPRHVGVDDWAIKKGRSYGTIATEVVHQRGEPVRNLRQTPVVWKERLRTQSACFISRLSPLKTISAETLGCCGRLGKHSGYRWATVHVLPWRGVKELRR